MAGFAGAAHVGSVRDYTKVLMLITGAALLLTQQLVPLEAFGRWRSRRLMLAASGT